MNAQLRVFKDCSSEEPTKVYICRRLLLGVSKKVQALSEKMQGKSEEEQEQITIDILKTIFPNFEADDFNYIDPTEYMLFVQAIAQETNSIIDSAAKN